MAVWIQPCEPLFSEFLYFFYRFLLTKGQTTAVSELNALWPRLMATNPQDRPSAQEVLDELGAFVQRTPPERLHVPFVEF